MDTNKAIEFVDEIYHDWENIFGADAEQNLESAKKKDQVISLLEQGEENKVYRRIVEAIENRMNERNEMNICLEDAFLGIQAIPFFWINNLKQKYLKEA